MKEVTYRQADRQTGREGVISQHPCSVYPASQAENKFIITCQNIYANMQVSCFKKNLYNYIYIDLAIYHYD